MILEPTVQLPLIGCHPLRSATGSSARRRIPAATSSAPTRATEQKAVIRIALGFAIFLTVCPAKYSVSSITYGRDEKAARLRSGDGFGRARCARNSAFAGHHSLCANCR